MMQGYKVQPATRFDCRPFILDIHYAKRWPSVSLAFALVHASRIVGVVTYGTPPCAPVRTGIAGKRYAQHVLELNRLCLLNNRPNEASTLVAASLRLLKRNAIILSFADIEHGHTGTVYQACGFGYYGLSAKRTDWKVEGMEHLHNQTLVDEFRGEENRAELMRQKYGDAFRLQERPRKHRYIKVVGGKTWVKEATSAILYQKQPYPKP